MSHRLRFVLLLPLVLLGGYFAVTAWIRAHVNALIQQSIGQPLPEFALVDQAGTAWQASGLRGKRAVLHFFRSYCHSCDAEAPAMLALEQRLPADVVLLHVMTDAVLAFPADVTAATLARKGFQRPVVMADARFMDAFHQVRWSQVTPVTYVVDRAGVIRFGLRGTQTVASVEQALAAVQ